HILAQDEVFSLAEVSAYLKIPKSTIYKLCQKGKLPAVKIGKQLRFRKSSLEQWFKEKESIQQPAKAILVIDDDPLVLKSLAKFLKTRGYSVDTAQDAQEAFAKVEKLKFDLIVTDIRMPKINGIEAIKRIRLINRQYNRAQVPEVIISGYLDTAAEQEAQSLGVGDYLYKPFALNDFMQVVQEKIKANAGLN
ncbi:MAG: response regulator, partial [Candidatus Omnitrophota bacterium]